MDSTAVGSKKKSSPIMWAASILGLLAGRYGGMYLLIPLAGAAAAFYGLKKLAPESKAHWSGAISIQVGHAIWFIVGLVAVGRLDGNALDPIVLLLGVCWLFAKPGVAPVLLLSVVQIGALAYNLHLFLDAGLGTNTNKALFVHIVFRALALGLMAFALYKSRKPLGVPVGLP